MRRVVLAALAVVSTAPAAWAGRLADKSLTGVDDRGENGLRSLTGVDDLDLARAISLSGVEDRGMRRGVSRFGLTTLGQDLGQARTRWVDSGSDQPAGSAATGSGSAAGTGPTIIQIPTDDFAPKVNAAAAPTVVNLGGRFTLIVTATFNNGVEVNLEEPFSLGASFEVRKKLSEDKPAGAGQTTREWQVDVLAWDIGDVAIAPIAVTYTFAGKVGRVATNVVKLKVIGVLGDEVDDPKLMRDLQAPRSFDVRDWFWALVAAGVGGAALATVLGLWWSKRRRHEHVVTLTGGAVLVTPKRLDMTAARALEALMVIEKSGVLKREAERRDGYAEMVDVIREYLGGRYRIATRDLTSSELQRALQETAPEEEVLGIEAWLERCDLVKYGGLRPSSRDAMTVLADARVLVVTTTDSATGPKRPAESATDKYDPRVKEGDA
ncbi:hypothetical protein BH11MYX2_BH11MYX2_40660 [soil metagenome]